MPPRKTNMVELKCPECGKVFFRSKDLARTVTKCPACQGLCTFNTSGKCVPIKQVKYAREAPNVLKILGKTTLAAGLLTTGLVAGTVAAPRIVKVLRMRRAVRVAFLNDLKQLLRKGHVIDNLAKRRGVRLKLNYPVKRSPLLESELRKAIPKMARKMTPVPRRLKLVAAAVPISIAAGLVAMPRRKKYARENPKHVRSYFNELKQHKVAFRTRMQWLSRIYGGKGGYTSEELYKIVTGKSTTGYYIFPFVKSAPPEVNRILERTYREHRAAGDGKVAAAIAAWTKVKQAGYVKVTKPAPVWVKKGRYNMKQLKSMQVVNYGAAASMGKLTERGVRSLLGAIKRHPRTTKVGGVFGVGYLTRKELMERRKRKVGYQIDVRHFTPNVKAPLDPKAMLKQKLAAGVSVGKRVGKTMSTAAKVAVVSLALKEVADFLVKRRNRSPWLPEVRHDIELGRYELDAVNVIVDYASGLPSKALQTIKAKTGAALHKTKTGVERGLLVWLLGFLSSELMGRGISKPQRRHEVVFPEGKKGYVRELRPNEAMPQYPIWGYHPVTPREFHPHKVPRIDRRPRGARLKKGVKKMGKVALLPTIAALLASRLSQRGEGYSFRSAASRTLRITKKVGGGLGKGMGVATNIAIPAMIISELWPKRRKRQLQPRPPVHSTPAWGYNKYLLATETGRQYILNLLAETYRAKGAPLKGQGWALTSGDWRGASSTARVRAARSAVAQGTLSSRQATHLLSQFGTKLSRLDWAKQLRRMRKSIGPRYANQEFIQMYPMQSEAQRRWMHATHPKMAKRWEKHTPEGKELPEKVSKHALSARQRRKVLHGARADQINARIRDINIAWKKNPMRRRANLASLGAGLLIGGGAALRIRRQRRKAAEKISKHALPLGRRGRAIAWGGIAGASALLGKMGHKRKLKERAGKKKPIGAVGHLARLSLLGPGAGPYYVGRGMAASRKKRPQDKYALSTKVLLRGLRGKMWFPDVLRLGRSVNLRKGTSQWANKIAQALRTKQAASTGSMASSIGKRADVWETLAGQLQEVASKVRLEKVGLVGLGAAGAVAAHETGKKRERQRIRTLVG